MHDVVRTVFARLLDLDPAIEEPKLQNNVGEDDLELRLSVGILPATENAPTEPETLIGLTPDQNNLSPPSAAVERAECTSLFRFPQTIC